MATWFTLSFHLLQGEQKGNLGLRRHCSTSLQAPTLVMHETICSNIVPALAMRAVITNVFWPEFMRSPLLSQFSKFAIVGAVATSVHYVVLILLVQALDLNPVHASATGFVCGAFVGYVLNYRVTFRSSKRHWETIPKFFLAALSGLVINTLIMMALTGGMNVHYLMSQVVATGMVLMWNFSVNRWWTFGENDRAERR